jgi:GDPmannose 4,6-dehydratase
MSKVALITGVTGQDGAYLSDFLLAKGYHVHGIKRRSSLFNTERIDHLYQDPHERNVHFSLHYGDLTDSTNLIRIIQEVQPDEIYNLAAQSHERIEAPEYTGNADGLGTLRPRSCAVGLTKKQKFTGINLNWIIQRRLNRCLLSIPARLYRSQIIILITKLCDMECMR